jgi:hypothetical protein
MTHVKFVSNFVAVMEVWVLGGLLTCPHHQSNASVTLCMAGCRIMCVTLHYSNACRYCHSHPHDPGV